MTPIWVLLVLLALDNLCNNCVNSSEETLSSEFVNQCIKDAMRMVDEAYKYTAEANQIKLAKRSVSPSTLLSVFKQPVRETRSVIRSAEYMDTALRLIQSRALRRFKRSINATDLLTSDDLSTIARVTGCAARTQQRTCRDTCFSRTYRSITGECNNLKNPRLGAVNTPFVRWLPPQYEDGFFLPRGWTPGKLYSGFPLPSVREVSNTFLHSVDQNFPPDEDVNAMFVQWGQWIDHDLDLTPQSSSLQTFNEGIDCEVTCIQKSPCFPIQLPPDDPRITADRSCLPFFRSSPVCGSGELGYIFGDVAIREQLNALTSFIDASMVYGSTETVAKRLRVPDSLLGLMDTNTEFRDDGLPYLPIDNNQNSPCKIVHKNEMPDETNPVSCFIAGDGRVTEQISLASVHTVFLREHNRLAFKLHNLNPHWSGEIIYQECRKIVGAMQQIITYRDFLPRLIGTRAMENFLPKYEGYDESVIPSVANVFSTAAFRFGHTMVQPMVPRMNETFQEHPQFNNIPLTKAFFASWRVINEGGIDPLVRGLFGTPAKQLRQNQVMNEMLRDHLFEITKQVALDLGSLNMQRGRDHGLPGYNDWRKFCDLSQPQNISELTEVFNNAELAAKLLEVYGSPNNIDVWLGGVLEPQVENGKVGPLLSCLTGTQFRHLRDGDRFWWENDDVFTTAQRESLSQITLSRIVCDNTHINEVPVDAFSFNSYPLGYSSCNAIAEFDLSTWKEDISSLF
ncbi:eosinophil peroxidase-like [Protopterus annectens]|uniref:eosinophil peroxidase-like n=1 Tax=Protopterus annectens TaxID=7888 RepID=UPI001CFACE35|nr:eosinophil peroxidase-like [Protopterus annectens]